MISRPVFLFRAVPAATLAAALFSTSPVVAADQTPEWLGAVGRFIVDGLEPARTMEDIRREEERARERALQQGGQEESKPAAVTVAPEVPVHVAAPVPVAPAPVEPEVLPVVVPPSPPAPVIAVPVAAAPVVPKPVVVAPVATPVGAAPPVAVPIPEARPKAAPAAVIKISEPPAEPLTNRIAATATVDQALRLGGPVEVYGAQKPAKSH